MTDAAALGRALDLLATVDVLVANAGFAERYLEMLAAGGTKHHSELLAPFGLDARDPKFWQGGLGVIERMIGELEELG